MRTPFLITVFLLGLLCCNVVTVEAAPIQWPANGNYYELILSTPDSLAPSWSDASAAAATLTHEGVTGHLVTITSAAENSFVFGLVPSTFSVTPTAGWANWRGAWLGGKAPDGWLVGPEAGDAFSYTNWNLSQPISEPNNDGYAYMRIDAGDGIWYDDSVAQNGVLTDWGQGVPDSLHDPVIGYFVEYESTPVPVPATILLFGSGLAGIAGFRWKKLFKK